MAEAIAEPGEELARTLPAPWAPVLAAATPIEIPARRTVVVVPHPDDEVLLSGGLIARQLRRRVPVVVVAVTDGEAAYPGLAQGPLAAQRRGEQVRALQALGVTSRSPFRLRRLGISDGTVAAHEGGLADELAALVGPDDLLVAPWIHDWHPDHEACGRAAIAAADHRHPLCWGGLFWAYHRVDPTAHRQLALVSLALDATELRRRNDAVAAHRSQWDRQVGTVRTAGTDPVLTPDLLDLLQTPVEHYVVAS